MRLGGKKFFYCKKNEVKCQKHDRFSITILEVSPTSSSWFSAVSPLAASSAPSVCCAVLVSCSTRPALSSRVSSACPSPCSALRSLSDLSSPSFHKLHKLQNKKFGNQVSSLEIKNQVWQVGRQRGRQGGIQVSSPRGRQAGIKGGR